MTGEYSCADTFNTDSNKWYSNEQSFDMKWQNILYYTNNNSIELLYVYQNMSVDDPIISISGPATIYATDQYWNTSSFQLITDKSNIPLSLRNKRYWLTPSSDIKIIPTRGNKGLWYTSEQSIPVINYMPIAGFHHTLSNPGHWYMIGNTIYSMDQTKITRVGNSTDDDYATTDSWVETQSYGYENIVISLMNGTNNFYVTDLNAATVVPTKTSNAAGIADLNRCHVSETKTGFVVCAESHRGSTSHKVLKIDMRNNTCVNTQLADARDACSIMLTDNYAYIDQTDQRIVYVKTLTTDTLVQTFNIPSDKNVAKFVFGYRDLVYVTDCSSYTYICNTTTGTMELSSNALNAAFSNSNYTNEIRMNAINECFVLYLNDRMFASGCGYTGKYNNPAGITSISSLNVTSYDSYRVHYEVNLIKLNSNSIILTVMNQYNRSGYTDAIIYFAYDFGKFLYNQTNDNLQLVVNNSAPWVPYGDYQIIGQRVVPNGNLISHRLVGTTNCVCTIQTFKNIRGKQWELKVSNIGSYSGLPPGNIQ